MTIKSYNHIFENLYPMAKELYEENPAFREDGTALSAALRGINLDEVIPLKPKSRVTNSMFFWAPGMINTPGIPERYLFDATVLEPDGTEREGVLDFGNYIQSRSIPVLYAQMRNGLVEEPLSKVPFHGNHDITSFVKRYVPETKGYWLFSLHKIDIPKGVKIEPYCEVHSHPFEETNHIYGKSLVVEYQICDLMFKVRGPAKIVIPMGVPHSQNVIEGKGFFEFTGNMYDYYGPVLTYAGEIPHKTITISRPAPLDPHAPSNIPDGYAKLEEFGKVRELRKKERKLENWLTPIKPSQYSGGIHKWILS